MQRPGGPGWLRRLTVLQGLVHPLMKLSLNFAHPLVMRGTDGAFSLAATVLPAIAPFTVGRRGLESAARGA